MKRINKQRLFNAFLKSLSTLVVFIIGVILFLSPIIIAISVNEPRWMLLYIVLYIILETYDNYNHGGE
jgi:hypothetical protein